MPAEANERRQIEAAAAAAPALHSDDDDAAAGRERVEQQTRPDIRDVSECERRELLYTAGGIFQTLQTKARQVPDRQTD